MKRTTTPDAMPEPLSESDYAPRADSDLPGYWKGTLAGLRLNVKIAEPTKGTFRAELDSIDEGLNGQPTSVSYDPPNVKLRVMTGAGMFEGQLSGNDAALAGTWTQGGWHTPVTFKRADRPAEQAREAQKDFSHAGQNDLPGHWKGTLKASRANVRFALDVARLPDATFSASLTRLDEDGTQIPAHTVQFSPPGVRLEWNGIGCTFNGKLENGRLVGVWRQNNRAFPLVFERNG
jgi:hypothetical protein